jgi:hypothetical protein
MRPAAAAGSAAMFLFDFYRWLLAIVCGVYAAVRVGQTLLRWVDFLAGPQAYKKVLRGYAGAMVLSVRLRRFTPDLLQILALLAALAAVLYAHRYVM